MKKCALKFSYNIIKPKNSNHLFVNESYVCESNYVNIISEKLNTIKDCLKFCSRITYKGSDYTCGQYVSIFTNDIEFHVILQIVVVIKHHQILFFSQKLKSVVHNQHFNAYECTTSNLESFSIISAGDVPTLPAHYCNKNSNGKNNAESVRIF